MTPAVVKRQPSTQYDAAAETRSFRAGVRVTEWHYTDRHSDQRAWAELHKAWPDQFPDVDYLID